MLLEQLALLGYHLRLDPDTELHAEILNPLDNISHRAAHLILIYKPVAET